MNRNRKRTRMRLLVILMTVIGGVVFAKFQIFEVQAATDNATAGRIADVAWIAGHWGTKIKESQLEEIWSAPRGDSMMGVFRWIREGKVWIYELLTIREEDATLVLRFRHFSSELVPWEEKNEPLTYRLVSHSDREAIFENPESESHRQFAFERVDDKTLVVRVGAIKDGALSVNEFRYNRQ